MWDGNTFTGVNVGGYQALIYTLNHCNVTMTNNNFVDIVWVNPHISLTIEHANI